MVVVSVPDAEFVSIVQVHSDGFTRAKSVPESGLNFMLSSDDSSFRLIEIEVGVISTSRFLARVPSGTGI